MKLLWEKIDKISDRLRVPGGWIVRYRETSGNKTGPGVGVGVCMLFVLDEKHKWVLESC